MEADGIVKDASASVFGEDEDRESETSVGARTRSRKGRGVFTPRTGASMRSLHTQEGSADTFSV